MQHIKKLVGSRCFLSPLCLEDAEAYTHMLNDLSVIENLNLGAAVITFHGEKEILSLLSKEHNYGIILKDTDELIGNCGLMEWDKLHQTAELGVFIGNKEFRGKGYGTEAIELLLDYAFTYLNIYSIRLRVFSFNTPAIACYEKLGFTRTGVWRQSHMVAGKRYDTYLYDYLASEFFEKKEKNSKS